MPARMQLKAALAVAGLLLLVAVSVWYLEEPYKDWIWVTQFEGFTTVLPTTAWAAFKTWTFWAFATVLVGLAFLKIDPKIGYCDAILGGAASVWVFAYIAGNLLGPIGLFNTWTIWLILIAAFVWIALNPPNLEFRVPSYGQRMALLACALMAVSTVPLELGSPVPPYMDALNVPAAVQRILTFGVY